MSKHERNGKSLKELKEDSLLFWGEPLNIKNQPFNSLRRKQLLIQLKKQFKINPREWTYEVGAGEGHCHSVINKYDRVENQSGDIVNNKTGKKVIFWFDWESRCNKSEESFSKCSHSSPKECGIKFYIDHFPDNWYLATDNYKKNWINPFRNV